MVNRFLKTIPGYIQWLFAVYLSGMVFFTIFRFILFVTNGAQVSALPEGERFTLLINAFLMGFRFDTVISCYIIVVPFLLFVISQFTPGKFQKIFWNSILILTGILYTLAFILCAADIPYFNYYFSRLTTAVLNWANEGKFMFGMVLKEPSYLAYVVLGIVVIILFSKWLRVVTVRYLKENTPQTKRIYRYLYPIITVLFLFIGIRGRVALKSPIRAGTAYFSSYAFPNQLGLNPVFTFLRSFLDDLDGKSKILQLMDESSADAHVREYLHGGTENGVLSPVYRNITDAGGKNAGMNVVVIIMESMSANKLGHFGNPHNLTPFLDSLIEVSYSFENFYSAGIHTFNGVFSTLYAFPSLLKQHPMKVTTIPKMTGLPVTLRANGYTTAFFTTHDEQFDNMAGFMYANGFEKIVSQKDYPQELVLGPTGVPDHVLFEQALPYLNAFENNKKPFFAAFLTASDHGPYNLPKDIPFKPNGNDIKQKIVQYADWSLRSFFTKAAQQKWYSNTIFVLVADHGANMDAAYAFPLSFVHTPCIIYSPRFTDAPKTLYQLGGQIDVFPTVMGLLGISYKNYTFGIDLFQESRPYMYFSNDEKIGCVDSTYYFMRQEDGREFLFRYGNKSTTDLKNTEKAKIDAMRKYSYSMMQAAQKLLHSGNTVK